MEQNRELRNKRTHIWSLNLSQRSQDYTMGKGQSVQQMVLAKLDSHMQKNKTRLLPYTIQKLTQNGIKT